MLRDSHRRTQKTPPPASGCSFTHSSPPLGSPSQRSWATTAPATTPATSPQRSTRSPTGSLAPNGRKPMAKTNGSPAASPPNGPTRVPTSTMKPGQPTTTTGSITTITTDPTPESTAQHPRPLFTTSRGTTSSRRSPAAVTHPTDSGRTGTRLLWPHVQDASE